MHTSLFPALHDKYKFCHSQDDAKTIRKGPCLERMGTTSMSRVLDGEASLVIHALRSRTLTSAGMDGVWSGSRRQNGEQKYDNARDLLQHEDEEENKNDDDNESEITGVLWTVLKQNFAINPFLVEKVQQFLLKHRATIAVENALGQCSTGHSCKGKAREKLQQIIKSSHNNNHAKFDDTTNATTII